MGKHLMKLQRAITSTEKNKPPTLAYNADRSVLFHVHLDPESEQKIFAKNPFKVYAMCEEVNGQLEVDISTVKIYGDF